MKAFSVKPMEIQHLLHVMFVQADVVFFENQDNRQGYHGDFYCLFDGPFKSAIAVCSILQN